MIRIRNIVIVGFNYLELLVVVNVRTFRPIGVV